MWKRRLWNFHHRTLRYQSRWTIGDKRLAMYSVGNVRNDATRRETGAKDTDVEINNNDKITVDGGSAMRWSIGSHSIEGGFDSHLRSCRIPLFGCIQRVYYSWNSNNIRNKQNKNSFSTFTLFIRLNFLYLYEIRFHVFFSMSVRNIKNLLEEIFPSDKSLCRKT